jgi:hypothetical protein
MSVCNMKFIFDFGFCAMSIHSTLVKREINAKTVAYNKQLLQRANAFFEARAAPASGLSARSSIIDIHITIYIHIYVYIYIYIYISSRPRCRTMAELNRTGSEVCKFYLTDGSSVRRNKNDLLRVKHRSPRGFVLHCDVNTGFNSCLFYLPKKYYVC